MHLVVCLQVHCFARVFAEPHTRWDYPHLLRTPQYAWIYLCPLSCSVCCSMLFSCVAASSHMMLTHSTSRTLLVACCAHGDACSTFPDCSCACAANHIMSRTSLQIYDSSTLQHSAATLMLRRTACSAHATRRVHTPNTTFAVHGRTARRLPQQYMSVLYSNARRYLSDVLLNAVLTNHILYIHLVYYCYTHTHILYYTPGCTTV
jgi:hypothetical protein